MIITKNSPKNKSTRRPQRFWHIYNDNNEALVRRIRAVLSRAGIRSAFGYSNTGKFGLRIAATRKRALPLILQSDALQDIGNYFYCETDKPGHYDFYAFVADDPEFADWETVQG